MWNGSINPELEIVKHRDYQHKTYAEHEFANGAEYELVAALMVDKNPVTEDSFDPPELYYQILFTTHIGVEYTYLIPAEADRSEPNPKRVRDTINAYAANPVKGGRNYRDYVADETLEEALSDNSVRTVRNSGKFHVDDLFA